jgi:hypothetical protein
MAINLLKRETSLKGGIQTKRLKAVFYFRERSVLTITQHGVPLFRALLTSRERFLPFTGRYPYGE